MIFGNIAKDLISDRRGKIRKTYVPVAKAYVNERVGSMFSVGNTICYSSGQSEKTEFLLNCARLNGYPILCADSTRADKLRQEASSKKFNDVSIIAFDCNYHNPQDCKDVLVDDVYSLLCRILHDKGWEFTYGTLYADDCSRLNCIDAI